MPASPLGPPFRPGQGQKRPETCFSSPVRVSKVILFGTFALTGLLASGCKKKAPEVAPEITNAVPVVTNVTVVPVSSRTRDLGVVLLTNRCETTIQLGDGKSCTLTPHKIDPKQLQITLALETRTTDGKIQALKIMKVITQPGQQFEMDFGSLNLTLTPQMAEETNAPSKTP